MRRWGRKSVLKGVERDERDEREEKKVCKRT
jgi:hypothetical protein